jgi:hypothetical protein
VGRWCDEREIPVGGLLDLKTAWRLAFAWYYDRLDPEWRRKGRQETQQLFSDLGMTSAFWQLGS